MVDQLTELLLPGRTVASRRGDPLAPAAGVTLPAYVAGAENQLVAAAVGELMHRNQADDAVAANPAILVLHGASGTGKTHLAQGLVRFWHDRYGPTSAEYFTATDFRRDFFAAIDTDTVAAFRERVRGRQLLAIDDVHRLADEPAVLDELRFTLDEIDELGGNVVVTSTRPIGTLAKFPLNLRGRFAAGLSLQLAPPGEAARDKLVRQMAAALGRQLSEQAVQALASGLCGTAPELFGAVLELCADPKVDNHNDARQANELLAARLDRRPALREIIKVVSRYYRQPQAVLKSASRRQSAVLARSAVVYLARELSKTSYEQIGRALGGRDHTTIMHNYRKIQRDRQHDAPTQEALDELRRILLSS